MGRYIEVKVVSECRVDTLGVLAPCSSAFEEENVVLEQGIDGSTVFGKTVTSRPLRT